MALPDLDDELTHHIGLEPQAQYLLAALLTGRAVHSGGRPLPTSSNGARLVAELTGMEPGARLDVVPDLGLRAVPDVGLPKGACPDFAFFWPGTAVLAEVKTDNKAERAGQLARYAALGLHYYPRLAVHLLYLTPHPSDECAPPGVGWRALRWREVIAAVRRVFDHAADQRERSVAESYAVWLEASIYGAPARTGRSRTRARGSPQRLREQRGGPSKPKAKPVSFEEALGAADDTVRNAYEVLTRWAGSRKVAPKPTGNRVAFNTRSGNTVFTLSPGSRSILLWVQRVRERGGEEKAERLLQAIRRFRPDASPKWPTLSCETVVASTPALEQQVLDPLVDLLR